MLERTGLEVVDVRVGRLPLEPAAIPGHGLRRVCSGMQKVSTTELATHPVFSPTGKLAWLGCGAKQGTQRVYVDGKAISPAAFTAAAPVANHTRALVLAGSF